MIRTNEGIMEAIPLGDLLGTLGLDKKDPIPQPEDLNTWLDLKARKLFITDEISEDTVSYVAYYIQRWNEEDALASIHPDKRTPIRVYIDTVGGSLLDTLHICDIMQASKTPIWTIVRAIAYSGGVLLAMSGHVRYAYKNSTFLIHRGSFGLSGNANSNFDITEFYNKLDESVHAYIVDNTKITKELLDKNMRKEWYMLSADALEAGIIDYITTEIV